MCNHEKSSYKFFIFNQSPSSTKQIENIKNLKKISPLSLRFFFFMYVIVHFLFICITFSNDTMKY